MSDFLSKFSKDNYDKDDKKKREEEKPSKSDVTEKETVKEANTTQKKEALSSVKPVAKPSDVTSKKDDTENVIASEDTAVDDIVIEVLDNGDITAEITEASPSVEKKLTLEDARRDDKTSSGEEVVEIDPEYQKKKKQKQLMIAGLALALIIVSSVVYYMVSYVKLPDFAGKPLTELQTWAKDNKMTIESTPTYTIEYEKNVIVSQETKANKKIKKGSKVLITLSQGADPDETVALPKFEGMKLTDINIWIDTNKMDNVRVIQEYSDTVEKDVFIKSEIRDKDVTNETFKRKNGANIYVSKGKETFEENIKVLDFKGKSKAEVEGWHKENKFTVDFTYEEAYDDKIEAGMVISQSIGVDTMVSKDKAITFVISKGKAMVVPNYSGTSLNTFESINAEGLNIVKREWYNPSAPYGAFLEQSVGAGANMSDNPTQMIEVFYSIGKPYISSLKGKTEGDLPQYFYDFSSKGANITYTVIYEANCELTKGDVTRADKENQFIDRNAHITIYVSSGRAGCPAE